MCQKVSLDQRIEQRTKNKLLLLYLIKVCSEDKRKNAQPLTKKRLNALVFLAQKMGIPFSYSGWVDVPDWYWDDRPFVVKIRELMGEKK